VTHPELELGSYIEAIAPDFLAAGFRKRKRDLVRRGATVRAEFQLAKSRDSRAGSLYFSAHALVFVPVLDKVFRSKEWYCLQPEDFEMRADDLYGTRTPKHYWHVDGEDARAEAIAALRECGERARAWFDGFGTREQVLHRMSERNAYLGRHSLDHAIRPALYLAALGDADESRAALDALRARIADDGNEQARLRSMLRKAAQLGIAIPD
jgi:hypothetical protein